MWLNLWSLAGFGGFLLLGWLCSRNRRQVVWRPVLWGVGLQFLLGMVIFSWPHSRIGIFALSAAVNRLIAASQEGVVFLFGSLGQAGSGSGFILATQTLPLIVIFSSLMALLYYWGVIPALIRWIAGGIYRIFRTSGAEAVIAASNIFVGIESVMAVRPYLDRMTRSELFLALTVGMSTVASSVLALYVAFLNPVFPSIAGHLISASVLSVPAAFAIAKLMEPEEELPVTRDWANCRLYEGERAGSFVEAILNGANDGARLAVGVGVLLLAMIGLLGMLRMISDGILPGGVTLERMLGWLFWPFAAMLGVPPGDIPVTAEMLGKRLLLTEIPSYLQLAEFAKNGSPRTTLICSYALCGFAHIASVAIFVGGIAALAPSRKGLLAGLGLKALLAATLTTLMTGAVAGIFSLSANPAILGN